MILSIDWVVKDQRLSSEMRVIFRCMGPVAGTTGNAIKRVSVHCLPPHGQFRPPPHSFHLRICFFMVNGFYKTNSRFAQVARSFSCVLLRNMLDIFLSLLSPINKSRRIGFDVSEPE